MANVLEIEGPLVKKASRESAETALVSHPSFPKGAAYTLEERNGHWFATILPNAKLAEFPPGDEDSDDEAPAEPKSEKPSFGDGDKSDEGGSDSDSDGGSDGPPKPKSEHGDKPSGGGVEAQIEALTALVTQLVTALGIGGPDASPVPPPPGPGPGGPPGPPGPPGHGHPGVQEIQHIKALKPGEAPPGTTPVGAPSFSSVQNNHPWAETLSKVASFYVDEKIGDTPLVTIHQELSSLASGVNAKIYQLRESVDENGERRAQAIISRY